MSGVPGHPAPHPGATGPTDALAAAEEAGRLVARLLREARAQLDEVRDEHAAERREAGRRADERAALARAGRFGEAVRRLQEDVDAGRTTWAAVLWGGCAAADAGDAAEVRARAAAAVSAVAEARADRGSPAPR